MSCRTEYRIVIPHAVGLLWLHVAIMCLLHPHDHCEMPVAVNSIHPSVLHKMYHIGNKADLKNVTFHSIKTISALQVL